MIRFILGFVLSIVITNWAYDELKLIDPTIEDAVAEATQILNLPTHDKWPFPKDFDLAALSSFEPINVFSIQDYLPDLKIFNVTDRLRNIRRIVIQKRRNQPVQPAVPQQKPYEMVSGEEIFIKHL